MTTTTGERRPSQRVPLGRLYVTRSINDRIATSTTFAKGITDALRRHMSGDWGEVCDEDAKLNDLALIHGDRLLSSYTIDGDTVWVLTEADRSSTCVLYPTEY